MASSRAPTQPAGSPSRHRHVRAVKGELPPKGHARGEELCLAAERDDLDAVQEILRAFSAEDGGYDPKNPETALDRMLRTHHPETGRKLPQSGEAARVLFGADGRTPLHAACAADAHGVVRCLLAAGFDPHSRGAFAGSEAPMPNGKSSRSDGTRGSASYTPQGKIR